MSEDDIIIETTAEGSGSFARLAAHNMANVIEGARAIEGYSLDLLMTRFGPSSAPRRPSMHLMVDTLPAPMPRIRQVHKVATRAGKQHRIKGAR